MHPYIQMNNNIYNGNTRNQEYGTRKYEKYNKNSSELVIVRQFTDNQNLIKSYTALCKVYTGYYGTSEIEHGLCACTVDNPLAKAQGVSLRTGAQTYKYLSWVYGVDRNICHEGH